MSILGLIPCDESCVYQEDGYCLLDTPALVTSQTDSHCVHYIQKKAADTSSTAIDEPHATLLG